MNAEALQIILTAAEKPSVITFAVVFGVLAWFLLNRGIIVPGAVSKLLIQMAHLEAADKACRERNEDLLRRIEALETQLSVHIRAMS